MAEPLAAAADIDTSGAPPDVGTERIAENDQLAEQCSHRRGTDWSPARRWRLAHLGWDIDMQR